MSERVRSILSQILAVPVSTLDRSSSPATISTWDSLKHMQLILALEEELSIQFPDDVVPMLNSVESIESAVRALLPDAD